MSTTVKDTVYPDSDYATVGKHRRDALTITVKDTESCGHTARAIVPRADFLAAVAAECDAIVIPRADLPEPNPEYTGVDPEGHRKLALWHLAQAEYLDAHPPVPEPSAEDIARMERLITSQPGWRRSATMLAADLLRSGRIEVRP